MSIVNEFEYSRNDLNVGDTIPVHKIMQNGEEKQINGKVISKTERLALVETDAGYKTCINFLDSNKHVE